MANSSQRKTGAILSYASIIVTTIVQLAYTPFLIRMLGQSEYGLYSLVSSIIGYLTILDFGFGNAIVIYTAKYRTNKNKEEEEKMHGMFHLIFNVTGIIVALLGLVIYFNVENIFGNSMNDVELSKTKIMTLILCFNLIASFAFNIYSSIISGYEKFAFQKIMAIISSLLRPLIMIPLLLLGCKSITMCIVITIINISTVLSNYLYCKQKLNIKVKFRGFDLKIFKKLFCYSFFIFLAVIVDKINWNVDQIILGAICGTVAVSIYSVASQFNQLFINLSTAISGVLLPKMSIMVENNASKEELTDELIKVGRLQFYIIFLMVSSLILIGKPFIVWWAGIDYENSYYVALLLIIPVCIPLIQNLAVSICQAMNKHKFRAFATTIMAIFNVGISIILANKYGPIGCAIGTAISLIIVNVIIMNIYYYKVIKLNIPKFWLNILSLLIPLSFLTIILAIMLKYILVDNIVVVLLIECIYVILYGILCYFILFNNYEKDIVKNALIKLHLKKIAKK